MEITLMYRAIDRYGHLVDLRLSETRDLAAAKAFFRSAREVTGVVSNRVTSDGHALYPRAIASELGEDVRPIARISLSTIISKCDSLTRNQARQELGGWVPSHMEEIIDGLRT